MGIITWFRSEPIRLFSAAVAGVSGLAIVNLIWGAVAQPAPPRLHLAALTAVLATGALVLAGMASRKSLYRTGARVLALVLFLGIGLGLGGYDHLLKVVLTAHGLPASLLASIIPAAFGPPGDWAYEALGILLLPLGLAGLGSLKALAVKGEEE